jgi:ketosteroid isomerase-like protein
MKRGRMELVMTAIDIVDEAWKALEGQDRVRLGDLLDEEIIFTDSAVFLEHPEFRGREEVLDFLLAMRSGYPDVRLRIDHIFMAGDRVVLQGFTTGNHARETVLFGRTIPACEGEINAPICQVCTVRSGKIVRADTYYDNATILSQIGLAPRRVNTPDANDDDSSSDLSPLRAADDVRGM